VWQLTQASGRDLAVLSAATLAVVLLQHAINLWNDVSDWRLGADREKWNSWVRYHQEDLDTAKWHGGLSFFAGGLLGLSLLIAADRLWILLIALPMIALPMVALGYGYNSGKRPLSYTWAGEWVTGLCYGPGVVGCLWLLVGQPVNFPMLMGTIAFGSLSMALLLSHQPPQIETDRAAGKHSFAVRFGAEATRGVARGLFGVFIVAWAVASYSAGSSVPALVVLIAAALWAGRALIKPELGPKRVLVAASGVVLVSVVASLIPSF
jgi:1,4-dihydroxy-2-naphthoate octaprenyltransferase